MKLRDNAELRSAVRREVNMISDHETPPLVDRILDAVDRALAAPSPGTGVLPRPLDKAAEWARMSGVDSRTPAAEPGKPATCAKCGGTRYYDAGGSTFDYGACPGCTPAAGTAPTPSIPVSTALVCGKCGILSFGSTCSRCGTRP